MSYFNFEPDQIEYLKQLVMDRIADDASFLRRIRQTVSPQWYKDTTKSVEVGSDILAKLKSPTVKEPDMTDTVPETTRDRIKSANPRTEAQYVARICAELGISEEHYMQAMKPRCIHGSIIDEPCAECDRPIALDRVETQE